MVIFVYTFSSLAHVTCICVSLQVAANLLVDSMLHLISFCYPKDGALLQRALSFYRLVIIWMVDLVGGFKMPLPPKCPMEFACIPEHFIDDAMDLLIITSRIPRALEGFVLVRFLF